MLCPKCTQPAAGFYHTERTCPQMAEAWQRVTDTVTEITNSTLPVTPESCLLGLRRRNKGDKQIHRYIDLAFALFKRLIATHWKAPHTPGHSNWQRDLMQASQAEAYTLRQLQRRELAQGGYDIWDAFIVAMEAKNDAHPP
ncbi:hypothetical protein NDU88_002365 [Pleurodeles waltl]|uniref:Uncharacterized protein n=1 Tax=Pleurodeles waltl TaxID=8319 RepID=A0AAV7MRF4_PLEWA|nr:hypothetical protein NDU88_002365 [Pleurodeles waltl]